jgi:hypothetical protein
MKAARKILTCSAGVPGRRDVRARENLLADDQFDHPSGVVILDEGPNLGDAALAQFGLGL